jgi:hypothetical protein
MTCFPQLALLALTLIAPDQCATYERIRVDFETARGRVWTASRNLDSYFGWQQESWENPQLELLHGWTFIEHAQSFPAPETGILLDGLIHVGRKEISYNANSQHGALPHEFAHFLSWVQDWPYRLSWAYTGHGGLPGVRALDILYFSLSTQLCYTYAPFCERPHQYSPTRDFEWQLNRAAHSVWCMALE